MALAVAVDSLDEVAEPLKEHYKEVNGRFFLDAEGIDAHPSVVGLKNNHDRLRKEVADAKARLRKFDGLDPEEHQRLKGELEDLQGQLETLKKSSGGDGRGKGSEEEYEARLERAAAKWKKEHEPELRTRDARITALEAENINLKAWQKRQTVESAIEKEAVKVVRPEAVDDVMRLGREIFSLSEEGKIVALDGPDEIRRGKDGIAYLTIQEWIATDLYRDKPHYFPPSTGGGAGGGAGGRGKYGGIVSKDDFKSEKEEADFMVKHGVEVYNSLPGKSKFLGQYTKP